jgi:hypothetical protein
LNRGSLDRYRAGYQFTPAEIRAVVPPDEWNFCRPLPSTSMRRKLPMLAIGARGRGLEHEARRVADLPSGRALALLLRVGAAAERSERR